MYLLLIPDKHKPIEGKPFWEQILKDDKLFRLDTQQNGIGLTLRYWFAEGKQWQAVAYVEFFYRSGPQQLELAAVDLTIQPMPAYLDREVIVKKILTLWKNLLGPYTLHDFYTGQKLPFGTNLRNRNRTTTLLSATLAEAWQMSTDIGKRIEGNTDTAAVLKLIKPLPKTVQPYILSLYMRRLAQRQQLTNTITEKVFTYGLPLCQKLTDGQQAFALYNIVLYYKHLKASLLANLSTEFITQKYLPFVLKLPGELEITHIVWLDLFLYFLDQNNTELYGDILATLIEYSKRSYSIFVPEMKALLQQHRKGNYLASVRAYYSWDIRVPWKALRTQYQDQHLGSTILSDFETNVLEQSYIAKLTLWQRISLMQYRPLWKRAVVSTTPRGSMWQPYVWLIVFLLVIVSGFARWYQTNPSPAEPRFSDRQHTTLFVKDRPVSVEVVTTPSSQARGLMYRSYLPADEGMLFVYSEPRQGGFWMKNTLIPLDILFMNSDGRIVAIKERFEPCPASLGDTCPTYTPSREYSYALELAGGTVDQLGLTIGDTIDLEE